MKANVSDTQKAGHANIDLVQLITSTLPRGEQSFIWLCIEEITMQADMNASNTCVNVGAAMERGIWQTIIAIDIFIASV